MNKKYKLISTAVVLALSSVGIAQQSAVAAQYLGEQAIDGVVNVTISDTNADKDKLFGGLYAEQVTNGVGVKQEVKSVTIKISNMTGEKQFDDIFAGGRAEGASAVSITGNTYLEIDAGDGKVVTQEDIFGGGYAYHNTKHPSSSSDGLLAKTGDTHIKFNSGEIHGLILGGGSVMGYPTNNPPDVALEANYVATAETGNTWVVIDGGKVTEAVIGGGKARITENTSHLELYAISGDTKIDVNGGSIGGIVGGGWAEVAQNQNNSTVSRNATSTVANTEINVSGDATVNKLYQTDEKAGLHITNAAFDGAIVGGGVAAYGGSDTTNHRYSKVESGEIKINVSGGLVDGAIYAGGVSSASERDTSNSCGEGGIATVKSATVNITGGTVTGNVYAGGASVALQGSSNAYAPGTTEIGSATIVLGGNAEVKGDIYAGGALFTVAVEGLDEKKEDFIAGNKVAEAKVIFDSADVKFEGEVIKGMLVEVAKTDGAESTQETIVNIATDFSLEGSANFNNGFRSSNEAVERLRQYAGAGVSAFTLDPGESNNGMKVILNDKQEIVDSDPILDPKTQEFVQTAVQSLMVWRNAMNDMNKRLGELRDIEGNTGVWARVNAGKHEYKSVDNDFQSLQFGADTKIESLANIHLGAALSYTRNDLSFDGGSGDSDVYTLAGYASWLGETGSFVDVVAKIGRIDSDASVTGTDGSYDATTYSLSAEIGHRFPVMSYGFIEPQLELNYGYVEGVSFNTNNNGLLTHSRIDSVDSLIGRAGVRAGIVCPQKKGTLYLRASVLREFQGEVTYTRGEGNFTEDLGDTWFEFGIGGSYNINANSQIYADFERTSSADLSEPWRVNLGFRYAF